MIRCCTLQQRVVVMASRPAVKKAAKPAAPRKSDPKKAAPVKSKAAPETITLKSVFEGIAEDQELSRKQGQEIMAAMIGTVTKHLKKGNRIRMSGLGILEVKSRAARKGRNPATGESIRIKASKRIAFRAAKELKEAV